MSKPLGIAADDEARFEVLPLGRSEEEAAQVSATVRLTVTCSPKHGPDWSVEVAGRLRALGHAVTVHLSGPLGWSETAITWACCWRASRGRGRMMSS
ncbi:MAG: hypothetical protein WBP81_21775 [Solirubrobacteraceae bacterium]